MDRLGRWTSGLEISRTTVLLVVGLLALAVPTAPPAQAASPTPAVLAASCASCHGPGGASPGAIPSINRLDAATMAARLRSFRSGETEVTVMNRIAKGYTDAEIEALVQYFAAPQR